MVPERREPCSRETADDTTSATTAGGPNVTHRPWMLWAEFRQPADGTEGLDPEKLLYFWKSRPTLVMAAAPV